MSRTCYTPPPHKCRGEFAVSRDENNLRGRLNVRARGADWLDGAHRAPRSIEQRQLRADVESELHHHVYCEVASGWDGTEHALLSVLVCGGVSANLD